MLTLSERRRHRRGLSFAVALAAFAVALTGCATTPPGDAEHTSVLSEAPVDVALDLDADAVTGAGSSEFLGVDFPLPDGSQSVTVVFECEGTERFTVELGDSMMLGQAPLTGTCGAPAELAWPITEQTRPKLTVFVANGAQWTATPTFSAGEFAFDDALTADCGAFALVYSEFSNADGGVTFYDAIDDEEWTVRVDEATSELGALAESAQSRVSTVIAGAYATVSDRTPTVGESLAGVERQIAEIKHACDLNHTPLIIRGEFGG